MSNQSNARFQTLFLRNKKNQNDAFAKYAFANIQKKILTLFRSYSLSEYVFFVGSFIWDLSLIHI